MQVKLSEDPSLSEIDRHVAALLELGVFPVVAYNETESVYVLPAILTAEEGGDGEYPRLEYQVSDGLEGKRSTSTNVETFAEAKRMVDALSAPLNLPYWKDACNHVRPRDQFLGALTCEGTRYDVYVYQDNALDAPVPEMNLCLRYSDQCSHYVSPGEVEDFVKICTTEQHRFCRGRAPYLYLKVLPMVEKWLAER